MIVYDLEVYPNFFLFQGYHVETERVILFEVSFRKNELTNLLDFLHACIRSRQVFVGFNNLNFDEPILQMIINNGELTTNEMIFQKCEAIIHGDSFKHMIWPDNRMLKQWDLFKINHFDNKARSTSLKMLEFNMRADSIQALPIKPGTYVNDVQADELVSYGVHDVMMTYKFLKECQPAVRLRYKLSDKYYIDFTNFNDTKIGKEFFIDLLEKRQSGICYDRDGWKKSPRQTIRHEIHLGDVIFDNIKFNDPEFQRVHQWLSSQTITETKGVFKNLSCTTGGIEYVFGLGGIHASVDPATVEACEQFAIIDVDVTSYYPRIAMVNRLYPEHLSEGFCDAYEQVFEMRKQYAKGTPENEMFKLALNGVYGDSNNKYSPFYDSQYTMAITINGQLLLCSLAEWFTSMTAQCSVIQANTDGLTLRVARSGLDEFNAVMKRWEKFTGLELEQAEYSRMFIRDVNNYIAEYTDGEVKRKGCYEYELPHHKNQSQMIVAKVAEAHLLHGADIRESVLFHDDIMDFMLRTKVPRSSRLLWGNEQSQNISRYYVSTDGKPLTKIMPELANKPGSGERSIGINVGYNVTVCNDLKDHIVKNIDYEYYISQVERITEVLKCK